MASTEHFDLRRSIRIFIFAAVAALLLAPPDSATATTSRHQKPSREARCGSGRQGTRKSGQACDPVAKTMEPSETDLQTPPPPRSLDATDVQAWADLYLRGPGWVGSDYDSEGVHLVTSEGAAITRFGTLRIFGREELFRPASRAGAFARSDRQEFEVDCQGDRVRVLAMQLFMENNLMGPSRDVPGARTGWMKATPGSRRAAQIHRLCEIGLKSASDELLPARKIGAAASSPPAP